MERQFDAYLRAERRTGVFLLAWGILTCAVAGWAYGHWQGDLLQALLFSTCMLSLVQARAGIRRLLIARRLKRELHPIVEIAPPTFAAQELPRLERREQAALTRRFFEQALLIMGLCFALAGGLRISGQFLLGAGLGLCVQAAVLLTVTLTSQWRDSIFRNEIEREKGP